MFEIVAFNTVQCKAATEIEAEAKRAKWQKSIDDHYRGPYVPGERVTIRKVAA